MRSVQLAATTLNEANKKNKLTAYFDILPSKTWSTSSRLSNVAARLPSYDCCGRHYDSSVDQLAHVHEYDLEQ